MHNVRKILIADSDKSSSMRLTRALLSQGWPVVAAADAIQARIVSRRESPSAVVLSSTLRGGSVEEMMQRMRYSAYTSATPVIVVAKSGGFSKEEAFQFGAAEYIEDAEDLTAICESIRKQVEGNSAPVSAPVERLSDPTRLAELTKVCVLDTAPSRLQDSITRIASLLLGVPVTLLSMVDEERQFFKSQVGLPAPWSTDRQTPLSHSFCQWVVSSEEELVVEDAREMEGLKGNLAIRDLGVIAYAGIPVRSVSGPVLGSFCAIDSKRRAWDHLELANLRNCANLAQAALALETPRTSSTSRCRALLTMTQNAIEILRRCETRPGCEANAPLLQLLEEQNRHLQQLMPERLPSGQAMAQTNSA